MSAKPTEPLRGDAAWRAELREIAKRNDAARAAGVQKRATKEAGQLAEEARRAKREQNGLPEQPGR